MTTITACRSCGSPVLKPVLSLGETPLANSFLTEEQIDEPEPTYPLELVFCPDCTLVQITETVPQEELFDHYLYFSSFSDTLLRHSREIVEELIAARGLDEKSLVVEIGSNDGYLLQYYVERGIPVLGIDPARNIVKVANERGINTLCEYFDEDLGRTLAAKGSRADVIHANNVLAHVTDLNGAVAGIGHVLKDDGIAVIEVPYIKPLIDRTEFDTIYHEHRCYFSLTALDRLFKRHGLIVADVERIPIHGGSLRIYVDKGDEQSERVLSLLEEEDEWGVDRYAFYKDFGDQVEALRDELVSLLRDLKAAGNHIAVYGASAKGSTLLNYFGVGPEILDFVVDRSTVKQGYYTPGTHLPILSPEVLLEERPDYVLLLTWNFAREILEQQKVYHEQGGKFIIPIPEVKII
jgi:SAM-dependent methyltransferase